MSEYPTNPASHEIAGTSETSSSGGVFTSYRKPVVLETETGRRPSTRTTLVISVTIIIASLLSGLAYNHFWEEASNDATRLIPASSSLYVRAWKPLESLNKALQMDRWVTTEPRESYMLPSGTLIQVRNHDIAGVPLPVWVRTILGARRIQLAVVPDRGRPVDIVAFIEPPHPARALEQFGAHMFPVDRRLGYDIREPNRRVGFVPWSAPILPLRMVALDPYILLTYGSNRALDTILAAKVGSVSEPLRTKKGFKDVDLSRLPMGGLRGFVESEHVFNLLVGKGGDDDINLWRRIWTQEIDVFEVSAEVGDLDDVLHVRVALPRLNLRPVTKAQNPVRTHRLLSRLPIDTQWAISLSFGSIDEPLTLVQRFHRSLEKTYKLPRTLESLGKTLSHFRSTFWNGASPELREALTGECIIARLSKDQGWIAIIGHEHPEAAEEFTALTLKKTLKSGFSLGVLGEGAERIHVLRPAMAGIDRSKDIFWQVQEDTVVVSSKRTSLNTLKTARITETSLGHGDTLQEATRSLHSNALATLLVNPNSALLKQNPWLYLVSKNLRPTFRMAATLQLHDSAIVVKANTGVWTLLSSLFLSDRQSLAKLAQPLKGRDCQTATMELCAYVPNARVCRPFEPRRQTLLQQACDTAGLKQ
jgi:hypothetical protein